MRLSELLRDVPLRGTMPSSDPEITSVTADSRMVRPGSLFVAIPGTQKDGSQFIPQALEKGAAAIVGRGQIEVDDERAALALIAANFYGRPADQLSLVGVTGTSGKTTTALMVESIFDAPVDGKSEPVGLIGTIEYRAGDERLSADRTTPDAVVLQEWFSKMVAAGVRNAVMEVSSHALALKRTHGVRFAAAIFTNLSQDHFDFHKDFEDYFAAKRILFDQIDRARPTAIVNIDDQYGRRLAEEMGSAAITFGRSDEAMIRPSDGFVIDVTGLHGTVMTPHGDVRMESKLLGQPNLYNWMGAIGAALSVGIAIENIEAGIRNLTAVRGRFEYVPSEDGGPTVIVDYAHKPDALEKLLHAVRSLAGERKLTVLFGCGGERDKGKRPQMGLIAGRLADFTILTSDNPRGEEPERILDDIEGGMTGLEPERYTRITDRREAIARAINEASEGEVIVIAGKGHETYQVTGDQVVHFDDREEAELALRKRTHKAATK